MKRVEDRGVKKNVENLPARLTLKTVAENAKKSEQTVKEYFKGEEGVDAIHLDPSRAGFPVDMIDKLTREVVSAAEMRKGKRYPEGLINSWREVVAKDNV